MLNYTTTARGEGFGPEPILPDGFGRWAAYLLLGAFVVWASLPWFGGGLETHVLRDDAFYQFAVARNLARGQGFTVDGVHAAAGVQVLWPVLLAGPAWILGAGHLPSVAAIVGLLLHVLSALLVFRLVDWFVSRAGAVALAIFYLSRPSLIAEAYNGQETALAMFALFVWARRALAWETDLPTSARGLVIWTLLLPWVRTDLLVFPAGLALAAVGARLFHLVPRRVGLVEFALLASFGLYLVLQKLLFGGWLPPSATAIPWLFHDSFAATHASFAETLRRYWWYVRPMLLGTPFRVAGFGFAVAGAWWLLAPLAVYKRSLPLIVVLAAAVLGARGVMPVFLAALLLGPTVGVVQRVAATPFGRAATGFWLGVLMLLLVHLPLRWYPRDYYFVPIALAGITTLLIGVGAWLDSRFPILFRSLFRRESAVWGLLLVLALGDRGLPRERFPWQAEMTFAARRVGEFVGDEPVAGFNSGILAWWHRGRVFNLDGAADGAAIPALRRRRLLEWLRDQECRFVLDSPRQIADTDPDPLAPHASGRFLGARGAAELTPLVAFDLSGVGGHHPGTDCQMLYGFDGAELATGAAEPRLVAADERGATLLLATHDGDALARVRLVRPDGSERPLAIAPSARAAPLVLCKVPEPHGRVQLPGGEELAW